MIKSFRDAKTRRFHAGGSARGFGGLDADAADELLAVLDAATSLDSISPLKSVGLHPLRGRLKGYWAITVNGPWRIIFQFREGHAHNVSIIDYHRG